jgi:glutamine synthetase
LADYVRSGEIGWKAAIELVRDILFRNSNKLYHLELKFEEIEDVSAPLSPDKYYSDVELLENFLKGRELPDFVRIYWNDFTATPRMRMIPFRKFMTLLDEGKSTAITLTKATLGLLQNDTAIPGISATGEYLLHPDFSSLKTGPIKGHVSMHGVFREKDGSRVDLCPRSLLERAVEYGAQNGLKFLLGFEIEFVLLRPAADIGPPNRFVLTENDGHAWSVSRAFADQRVSDLLGDMVGELADMGIYVEQVHAESGTGQFELVLPPLPPVEAVDALLHTREVMYALATNAGYRMTLHPKPNPITCGTASHAHISIASPNGAKSAVYESFYAGVLKHMRGLTALTYSNPTSYQRLKDSAWAGGRWVTWGTQNRETALRKIEGSHWELKIMDGLANPYFAMGGVLLAGIHGVENKEELIWRDCEVDPAELTENDRKELRVTEMLPGTVQEALDALRTDGTLVEYLGEELVERYTAVKEAEVNLIEKMDEGQQWQWITERY